MNKKITENTKISTILETIPTAERIMIEKYQIFCAGCPMARIETLKQGADSHNLSAKKLKNLVDELNQAIK